MLVSASAKSLRGPPRQPTWRLPLQHISAWADTAAVRHASLSAIHRGLRRSERAQFADKEEPRFSRSRDSRDYGRPTTSRRSDGFDRMTAKALGGASSSRQQHKLRKKLDLKAADAEDADESGRQTRRKRFLDPNYSFGKRSLVYQLRYGSLRHTAASLDIQEPVGPRRRTYSNDDEPVRRDDHGVGSRMRTLAEDEQPAHHGDGYRHRRAPWLRQQPEEEHGRAERNVDSRHRHRQAPRAPAPWHDQQREEQQTRAWRNTDRADDAPAPPKKRDATPPTVTYTTAASQFLYGRSVVKAALEQGRRRLYKLYVQAGENRRRDAKDSETIMALAHSRDLPVTIVPGEDQRLMDRMSTGRPHNGFVLETSPLPQPPIKSLGALEESPFRLGFHIALDHQTAEQKAVNGEDTFLGKAQNATTSKPLVLLLHEILDPGNLGALLRTASYMGVDAVGITTRGSSHLTPVVLKSAAGAAEEVTIFSVNSPVDFLRDSRAAGWKTYAAVAPPEKKLVRLHGGKFISTEDIERERPLDRHPCVVVLGNEGYGLPRPVKVASDFELSVPKFVRGGSVDSLNVSVAAGLLCHAFVKEAAARSDVGGEEARSVSRLAVGLEKPSVAESEDGLF